MCSNRRLVGGLPQPGALTTKTMDFSVGLGKLGVRGGRLPLHGADETLQRRLGGVEIVDLFCVRVSLFTELVTLATKVSTFRSQCNKLRVLCVRDLSVCLRRTGR